MAKIHSILKPVTTKSKEQSDAIDQFIDQASYNCFTVEHLKNATGHIHELSLMLYEAKESKELESMITGIEILMDFYANEIESCTEYFAQIVEKGQALRKQLAEGGAE